MYSFHNPYHLSPLHNKQTQDYSNNMLVIGILTCTDYVETLRNSFRNGMHYYFDIPSAHSDYLASIICDKHYYGNTKSFLEIFDKNNLFDKFHNRNGEFAFIIDFERQKRKSTAKVIMPNVNPDCTIEENIQPKFGKKPIRITKSQKVISYVSRVYEYWFRLTLCY